MKILRAFVFIISVLTLWDTSAEAKSLPKIKHIIVLMMENRSFDHMLGHSNLKGYDAVTGKKTRIDGINPSRIRDMKVRPTPDAQFVINSDPPHEFLDVMIQLGISTPETQMRALSGNPSFGCFSCSFPHSQKISLSSPLKGPSLEHREPRSSCSTTSSTSRNSDFYSESEYSSQDETSQTWLQPNWFVDAFKYDVSKKGQTLSDEDARVVLSGFSPDRLPVLNALAKEYAVLDHSFSSVPGPTWPNRFFVVAGTSKGLVNSPDPRAVFWNPEEFNFKALVGMNFKTIFKRLRQKGQSWRVYHHSMPQVLAIRGMRAKWIGSKMCLPNSHSQRFSEFKTFIEDARKGTLPSYSFIEPNYGNTEDFTGGNSQHPVGDVRDGEALIKQVYETVRNSISWKDSLLIVTYDEHGGFYDHVRPPATVATGKDKQFAGERYNGFRIKFDFKSLGLRVPTLVISPYVPRNTIDHRTYDHTSILKTVEERFGMKPLTQRDRQALSFDSLLSLDHPRRGDDAIRELPSPRFDIQERDVVPRNQDTKLSEFDHGAASYALIARMMDEKIPDNSRGRRRQKPKLETLNDASQYIRGVSQRMTTHSYRD